jgi:hypothetical protein
VGLGTNSTLDAIVHSTLHRSLDRAYPATVTIQAPTESRADDMSVIRTWANVSGATAVGGILAAAKAEEIRRAALTGVKLTHVCDLQAYYPAILATHRALVARADGETAVTFNITGVKHDSQAASTRLELELVSH